MKTWWLTLCGCVLCAANAWTQRPVDNGPVALPATPTEHPQASPGQAVSLGDPPFLLVYVARYGENVAPRIALGLEKPVLKIAAVEWDVKRMTTSILLAAHDAKLKSREAAEAAGNFLGTYTGMMKRLVKMPVLAVARYQVHRLGAVAPISKILQKAERATALGTLEKLTVEYPKARVFRSNPPLLRRVEGTERDAVLASLKEYGESLQPERRCFFARFKPVDVGFKVVGTGSVGLRAYVVYMEGNGPGDPLFLQIKQEVASCYSPYVKHDRKIHNGKRVVDGQRAMQLQSDPLLGWTQVGEYDFLVRQLSDHKASIDLTKLKLRDLAQYAEVCGEMLARGHARSGDVRAIAGYIGSGRQFGRAVLDFAEAYADQAAADWKVFVREHPLKKTSPKR